MRFWRVASVFASVTHSMYSRRWLGLNASKAFRAAGRFFRAAAKSAGTRTGVFAAAGFLLTLMPSSFSLAAFLI